MSETHTNGAAPDPAARLAERWGASLKDEREPDDSGQAAEESDSERQESAVERMTERFNRAEPEHEEQEAGDDAGELDSGESDEDSGGEPAAFSDLDDLLNAGGVTAEALTVSVKRNGREERVPLSEALQSTMLEADYRQKTAAHAEAVRQFEAERAAHAAAVQSVTEQASAMQSVIDETFKAQEDEIHKAYGGVDWNRLLQEDRTEWLVAQQQYKAALDAVNARKATAQQALEAKVAEASQGAAQVSEEYHAEQRRKLVEYLPEWSDEKVRGERFQASADYLVKNFGVEPEQIPRMVDARYWALASRSEERDRWAARAAEAGKTVDEILDAALAAPKVVEKVRKGTLQPGAGGARGRLQPQTRRAQEAREKLRKSGKQDDAVAALRERWS